VDAGSTEVKSFDLALVVQLFVFSHELSESRVKLHNLSFPDLSLVEDSDGVNELAEVSEIRFWQEIEEQARSKDKDVRQEFPCLVTARDPLGGISGRHVKRSWDVRCHGGDGLSMPFPHFTLQDRPGPRRLVVRCLALDRAMPETDEQLSDVQRNQVHEVSCKAAWQCEHSTRRKSG
jgi:hypothetical protein